MGCGCGNRLRPVQPNPVEQKMPTAGAGTVIRTPSEGGTSSGGTSPVAGQCFMMYTEIALLDKKAVKLYNHLRVSDTNGAKLYLELNSRLRAWIVQLKYGCPDEVMYNEVKELVNNEYAKHFQPV
jgi:hypothetical protein